MTHNVQGFTVASWITVWGRPFTTGTVTAYARTGSASSSTTGMGTDVLTPTYGHRNIQLVSPMLIAYTTSTGIPSTNSGFVLADFTFTTAPEPGAVVMLGLGLGAIVALHRVRRRH
jgi:hypothetical protein